jgi:hypothetical protein
LPTDKKNSWHKYTHFYRIQLWVLIGSDPDSTDSLDPDLGSSGQSPKEEKKEEKFMFKQLWRPGGLDPFLGVQEEILTFLIR